MQNERRILCVCPSFPPIAYPDCLRLRLILPYLQELGWKATVLCIDPKFIEGPIDTNLSEILPRDLEIIYSYCIPPKLSRKLGVGNLAVRSLPFLVKSVEQKFEEKAFDLVFFSTTVFLSMVLGRYWLWRYKIPYIIDLQDPWLNDYSGNISSIPQLAKYKFSQAIDSRLEPFTLKKASHIISVSQGYVDTLLNRYDWIKPELFTVLTFGAAETDFNYLKKELVEQLFFNKTDGKQHWVYVGRGGADMEFAVRCLFRALARSRQQQPERFNHVMLHFIGTDYAPEKPQKTIEPIAWEEGIGDMVSEHPQRIPYFQALQCLLDADALIVPGSDDQNYTASKIYPYILAKKPLLAIFHEKSSVVNVLKSTKAGTVVTFKTGAEIEQVADAIATDWLKVPPLSPETNWEAFQDYTAKKMAARLCDIFDHVNISASRV